MYRDYVIGIDVGGTKILTALADGRGQVLDEWEIPTMAALGGQHTLERVLESVQRVLERTGINIQKLHSVAVGVPGQVDVTRGWVYFCPNLDWAQLPLAEILQQHLQVPVYIENDCNAGALGEQVFGAGVGANNVVYLAVGTGVGGGIVINNNIYHGTGSAGELGHMTIMPDGPCCGCGNQGCLESVASGSAITTAARELVDQGMGEALLQVVRGQREKISVQTVVAAAKQGDSQSKALLAGAARALGIGVANIVNLFSPQLVIVGGGVMKSKEMFWSLMEKEAVTRALPTPWERVKLVPGTLGGRAGVLGLVALALQKHR